MRKLAAIRRVTAKHSIPERDRIELVMVGGWSVISQKDIYQVGDLVVYLEPDCVLPENDMFKELLGERFKVTQSQDEETDEKFSGHRLSTMKMAGVVSHGMIMKIPNSWLLGGDGTVQEGDDVTERLGIKKYGRPFNPNLRVSVRPDHLMPFPSFLVKTDQERVQNLVHQVWDAYQKNVHFQVTQKIHGESVTLFYKDGEVGMCSRNYQLKTVSADGECDNPKIKLLLKNIANHCISNNCNLAFQFERVSPSLHKNFEGVAGEVFLLYNVYDIDAQRYITPAWLKPIATDIDCQTVPVIFDSISLVGLFGVVEDAQQLVDIIIKHAEGGSLTGGKFREGFVYKQNRDWLGAPIFSFKAISNQFLLANK